MHINFAIFPEKVKKCVFEPKTIKTNRPKKMTNEPQIQSKKRPWGEKPAKNNFLAHFLSLKGPFTLNQQTSNKQTMMMTSKWRK